MSPNGIIDGYRITYGSPVSGVGGGERTTTLAPPFFITDLVPNTAYTVRVAAMNDAGNGALSDTEPQDSPFGGKYIYMYIYIFTCTCTCMYITRVWFITLQHVHVQYIRIIICIREALSYMFMLLIIINGDFCCFLSLSAVDPPTITQVNGPELGQAVVMRGSLSTRYGAVGWVGSLLSVWHVS